MHVRAESPLDLNEVQRRLTRLAAGPHGEPSLRLEAARVVPKFFLRAPCLVFSPAAEARVEKNEGGTAIVLRLMWGPLPAPFPRAVAGVASLIALLWLGAQPSLTTAAFAFAVVALPGLALVLQRRGERGLQQRIARLLEASSFEAVAH